MMNAPDLLAKINEICDYLERPGVVESLTPADAALVLDAFTVPITALNIAISQRPNLLDTFAAEHLALVIRFGTPDVQAAARRRLDNLTVAHVH